MRTPVLEHEPSLQLMSKLDLIKAKATCSAALRGTMDLEQSGLEAAIYEDRCRAGLENSWVEHLTLSCFSADALDDVRCELADCIGNQWNSSQVAGRSYYPFGGFMGWHSNHTRPGRRAYCIHNERAGSTFRYVEPSGTIRIVPERMGWNIHEFSIPKGEPRFWHAVHAGGGPRFALGFRLLPC